MKLQSMFENIAATSNNCRQSKHNVRNTSLEFFWQDFITDPHDFFTKFLKCCRFAVVINFRLQSAPKPIVEGVKIRRSWWPSSSTHPADNSLFRESLTLIISNFEREMGLGHRLA